MIVLKLVVMKMKPSVEAENFLCIKKVLKNKNISDYALFSFIQNSQLSVTTVTNSQFQMLRALVSKR